MTDKQLLADARTHRSGENIGLLESEGFDQSYGIVRHLRHGRVVFVRVGGQAHAAVIKQDQLVLLASSSIIAGSHRLIIDINPLITSTAKQW